MLTPSTAIDRVNLYHSYTDDEQIEAWQYLHDTGLAYSLSDVYGRECCRLIDAGVITTKPSTI